uniref:Reverse transcriptase domain-containing protein n=1 Tax=Fagus sylvatica TaxID=28930 RepID=A0A2N9G6K5_FAGSY
MGDFNELVRIEEKQGRHHRSERQMQLFRDVLDDCGFMDFGFTGPQFTWTNNRAGDMTWERLDRVVATPEWVSLFPSARVHHLDCRWSDHKPIWIGTEKMVKPARKPFRFEEVWMSDSSCEETIEAAWKKSKPGVPMYSVWEKIHECRRDLRVWSRTNFRNIKQQIRETEDQLKQAEANSMRGHDHAQVIILKEKLQILLAKDERVWKQRSRVEWLREGDQNTRYFHSKATQRHRRNYVYRLKNNSAHVEQVAECITPMVTAEMNRSLIKEFTSAEVFKALKQMAPLKAPGPDGLPPVFFQKYWHLIGEDVTKAVLTCLNTGKILKAINHTHITLIPKVKNPEDVKEFRPISLCNVIYKLISKVLTNRLKSMLPHIVSESQSAFVPGRLITDNILVAFETLHHMHHQKKGKTGTMALKLDMSKAYDRVEWKFLKCVMDRMGFHPKWVSLMLECITTVSYSILVNEGLHSLIQKAKLAGELQGVSISRGGPKITHLFFADDSLLFCKATTQDVTRIQNILNEYEMASGQQINRLKTTIFFSKSTPQANQDSILGMLGVPAIKQYEKYLGLPSFVGRAKYSSFAQIKERVWSKLKGWKEKLISQAGREVLIKAVAQAIPTFAMSCFRLPARLIKEIEVLIRRFWWGQSGDRGKIHWVPWSTLCKPKKSGGLGLRDLGKFNEALLAKQVWRLMHNTSSLFYRVFKSKYFPRCSILEAKPNTRGSLAWKSIAGATSLINKGLIWRVGSGKRIRIWEDSWLPIREHPSIVSPRPPHTSLTHVSNLIEEHSNTWKEGIIKSSFLPNEAEAILGIPLSSMHPKDTAVWSGTKNGIYSVRSGYHVLLSEGSRDCPGSSEISFETQVWNAIWSLKIPAKVRHFLWRACHEALPTRTNLHFRHVIPDPRCANCNEVNETVLHALWQCKQIREIWIAVPWSSSMLQNQYLNFMELFHHCHATLPATELQLFATTTWLIWHQRNRQWLNQQPVPVNQLMIHAQQFLSEFLAAQVSHSSTTGPPAPPIKVVWKPPQPGRYKANFDGAFFEESHEAGVGVIIRNHKGEVMASLCQRIPFPQFCRSLGSLCSKKRSPVVQRFGSQGG